MKKVLAVLLSLSLFAFGTAWAQTAALPSLTVTFVENPTTGYTWSVAVSDAAILSLVDPGFTAAPGGAEGAAGTHSWMLTGLAEGDATVTFTYAQGWEGGEGLQPIVYTIHVDAQLQLTVASVTGYPELYMPDKGAVLLLENPTTGYQWSYTLSAEGVLTLERDAYTAPEVTPGTAGAGGTHLWVFAPAGEGDVTATFVYARSWEKDVEPEATVTYTFHVDASGAVTLTEMGGDYETYDPLMATATAE